MSTQRRLGSVIGVPIDALTWDEALARISGWATAHESRYICICNAHSCVTATSNAEFLEVIRGADMAAPDGAPVAWMLRRIGFGSQERINGPDLMLKYCEQAAKRGDSIFLYGSTVATLDALSAALLSSYPGLRIAGSFAPPFRSLTREEDEAIVAQINASGAGTVWVGLGCPKQELWMAHHRGRVNAAMIGVGAAFDYHAGTIRRAPIWMQRNGLEWLHRFASEPRRLWRRYLVTNTRFVLSAFRQILSQSGRKT